MTLATDYLGLDALLSAEELTWRVTVFSALRNARDHVTGGDQIGRNRIADRGSERVVLT